MPEDLSLPVWVKIAGGILGTAALGISRALFSKAKSSNAEDRILELESKVKKMQLELAALSDLRPDLDSLTDRVHRTENGVRDVRRELRDGLLELKETIERLVSQIQ